MERKDKGAVRKELKQSDLVWNNKFFIVLMLIPFLKPELINFLRGINRIFTLWLVAAIGITVLLYIKTMKGITISFLLICLYQGILIFSTITQAGLTGTGYRKLFATIFVCMLIEVFLWHNAIVFCKSLYLLLWIYVFINIWTEFRRDIGFGPVYFLGYRVAFIYPMLTAVFLGDILFHICGKKILWLQIPLVAMVLFAMYYEWVGTGLIAIAAYYGICIILYSIKKARKYLTCGRMIFAAAALNIAIVFFRIQNIFAFLLVDILHKSLTLSSRTYIWDAAIKMIKEKPILGHGVETYTVNVFFGKYSYLHNQILQFLMEGGIAVVIVFALITILACKNINRYRDEKTAIPVIAAIVTNGIIMIPEIPANYYYIFITYVIAINFQKIMDGKGKEEERNGKGISYCSGL